MLNKIMSGFKTTLNLQVAEKLLAILGPKFGSDRTAVMIAVCDAKTGTTICIPIGTFSSLKRRRECTRNALEKATRLLNSGEATSFMSADEEKNHYGGGIYLPKYDLIVAISALPPEGDEAMSLLYGATLAVGEDIATGQIEYSSLNFDAFWTHCLVRFDQIVEEMIPVCKDGELIRAAAKSFKKDFHVCFLVNR